jgi:leader peptidase (prepilin peptidase)/N-methyltransferase
MGSKMLRVLRKTAGRTGRFLGLALAWREPEYAPIALGFIAGWIWLLANLHSDVSGFEFASAAVYLSSLLAAVCAIDARYGVIPDGTVAALALGGLVQTMLASQRALLLDLLQSMIGAAVFFLAAYLFRAGYRRFRGYHGLGLGDVKFAAAGMLWIDIEAAPWLLIVAVLSALSSLLILRAQGHRLSGEKAIAFGPHLAIGLWLSWIMGALQWRL